MKSKLMELMNVKTKMLSEDQRIKTTKGIEDGDEER